VSSRRDNKANRATVRCTQYQTPRLEPSLLANQDRATARAHGSPSAVRPTIKKGPVASTAALCRHDLYCYGLFTRPCAPCGRPVASSYRPRTRGICRWPKSGFSTDRALTRRQSRRLFRQCSTAPDLLSSARVNVACILLPQAARVRACERPLSCCVRRATPCWVKGGDIYAADTFSVRALAATVDGRPSMDPSAFAIGLLFGVQTSLTAHIDALVAHLRSAMSADLRRL